jgi:hypothetical protein
MNVFGTPVKQDRSLIRRVTHLQVTPPPLENGDRLTRTEFERRYTFSSAATFEGMRKAALSLVEEARPAV